jgi:inner membrane protease subunit 2
MEFVRYIVKNVLVAGAVGVTFYDLVAYVQPVSGVSMQPLINPKEESDSDLLLLWRLPVHLRKIERGDVVTLVSPKNPNERYIKRVIGLPGDVIKTISYKKRYVVVPPGHCWIEGDNHDRSYDSNAFGVIPMGLLTAKAGFIIWPIRRVSKIPTEMPERRRVMKKLKDGDGIDSEIVDLDVVETMADQSHFNDPDINLNEKLNDTQQPKSSNYYIDFVP